MKRPAKDPLSKLDQKELVWLFGILKDACRERLEKNLISQAVEDHLFQQHGPVPGRIDPRPKLKEWEPRYRKFLAVANELHEQLQASQCGDAAEALAERLVGGARRPKRARA
jgi:hypothetical protein